LDRTLLRYWPDIPIGKVQECLDFLGKYASVKNTKESHSVTDPAVNKENVPGKWHHAQEYAQPRRPASEPDVQDVFQMMQLGWVAAGDSLPTPVLLTDDKALLSPFAHDITSTKNAYVWEYRWIDPAYAQTLRNTIALTTGVIDAKIVKVDDGSCNIQALTQTNTWNGTLAQVWEKTNQHHGFAAEKVVETYDHIPLTDLAAFKTTLQTATSGYKVTSLTDSTDETKGCARIVQEQDKLFPGTVSASNGTLNEEEYLQLITGGVIRTTMWLGVADADLATSMATVAVAPTGYTVLKVSNNYNGTGSFTLIRTMMLKAASPTVAMKMKVEWPSFDDETRTYFYFGMDKAAADAMLITAQTTCDAGYKVDLVEIQEWRLGMLVVIQQISKLNLTLTGQVRSYDYTKSFGLVNIATTVYLNVAKASITALKATILADATKIILDLKDDDVGQGKTLVTCVWRSKPDAPVALGAIQQTGPMQFHQSVQDRLWIDVNLTDKDALATAVALAMAGSAPYAVATGDTIQEASGDDAGDKTGIIRQKISKKPATYTPADYSMQESLNPHGLQAATMLISVREFPEVAYANIAAQFTALQTFLGTPAKGRIQVSMNENETFAMRALKEGTPTWGNATGTGVKVEIQNPGLIGETKTELATGVPVASAAALVAAATPDADHALVRVGMTERGQGEATITKEQSKKSETAIVVKATPAIGTQRAAEERTWPLVLNSNINTVWTAALTEGVTGDFVLKYRQKELVNGGMWRVSNVVEAAKEVVVSEFTSEIRGDFSEVVEKKQDATAVPSITNSVGVNVSVSGELNALNKINYEKKTATATSQEVSGSFPDRNGTTRFWAGKNCTEAQYAAAISAAALTSDTDNDVRKESTQFKNLVDYRIIKRPVNVSWAAAARDNNAGYGPYTEVSVRWNNDCSQYLTITTTFKIFYRVSESDILTAISGGGPGTEKWSDGVQWKGKKVTNVTPSAWAPAPTSTGINF
jgi:hypothetical protein